MRTLAVASVVAAVLVGPLAHAKGPSSTMARVRAALETVYAAGCLSAAAGPGVERARLAVVVYPDGAWGIALGPAAPKRAVEVAEWEGLRACVELQLAATLGERLEAPPASLAVVSRVVSLAPPKETEDGARIDGTRGAVCDYGSYARREEQRVRLPTPAPCRRGLTCCHGGHPGSGGRCAAVPVGMCPPMP